MSWGAGFDVGSPSTTRIGRQSRHGSTSAEANDSERCRLRCCRWTGGDVLRPPFHRRLLLGEPSERYSFPTCSATASGAQDPRRLTGKHRTKNTLREARKKTTKRRRKTNEIKEKETKKGKKRNRNTRLAAEVARRRLNARRQRLVMTE